MFRFYLYTGYPLHLYSGWHSVFYNNFLFTHVYSTFCKVGSNNHGQHFRSKSNSNSNSKQQCLHPVIFTKPLIRNITGVITSINRIRRKLTLLTPMSKEVSGRLETRFRLILPKYVKIPVLATTTVAEPLTTLVPIKQIF